MLCRHYLSINNQLFFQKKFFESLVLNDFFFKLMIFFFSLDIEGGEFQDLQTIPWEKVKGEVLL